MAVAGSARAGGGASTAGGAQDLRPLDKEGRSIATSGCSSTPRIACLSTTPLGVANQQPSSALSVLLERLRFLLLLHVLPACVQVELVVQMINGFFFVCIEGKGYRTCSGLIEIESLVSNQEIFGLCRKKWLENNGPRWMIFRATSPDGQWCLPSNKQKAATIDGWRRPQQLDSSSLSRQEAPESWGGSRPSRSFGMELSKRIVTGIWVF
ncbi:uncharacterized protein LOC124646950 [Lolium rigidum]|uniref:uncharacterized protein LOC124646950 n=1 Tax=Lolium rigidum TaxID=89674 RepID=UPI001F5DE29E|nr:uncharacterized protein LOC124646950 [Lolium rigidum]